MILDRNGAYTSPTPEFKTIKGYFRLVSTETPEGSEEDWSQKQLTWKNRSLGNTLDTFVHKESGEYFTWSRKQIAKWQDEGMLRPQ